VLYFELRAFHVILLLPLRSIHLALHVYTFMLLDHSWKCKPKSVTLALDRLVIGECVFDDVTILFHFWFGESAGLEKILFR
jgi:hypothetical protein